MSIGGVSIPMSRNLETDAYRRRRDLILWSSLRASSIIGPMGVKRPREEMFK